MHWPPHQRVVAGKLQHRIRKVLCASKLSAWLVGDFTGALGGKRRGDRGRDEGKWSEECFCKNIFLANAEHAQLSEAQLDHKIGLVTDVVGSTLTSRFIQFLLVSLKVPGSRCTINHEVSSDLFSSWLLPLDWHSYLLHWSSKLWSICRASGPVCFKFRSTHTGAIWLHYLGLLVWLHLGNYTLVEMLTRKQDWTHIFRFEALVFYPMFNTKQTNL